MWSAGRKDSLLLVHSVTSGCSGKMATNCVCKTKQRLRRDPAVFKKDFTCKGGWLRKENGLNLWLTRHHRSWIAAHFFSLAVVKPPFFFLKPPNGTCSFYWPFKWQEQALNWNDWSQGWIYSSSHLLLHHLFFRNQPQNCCTSVALKLFCNEVSACFPQVSWMWRCHVLWKSTPHWRSWSRSKPTWKKSSRTTQRTAPASHRLCPPPHCPPPQRLSPGPVSAARIPTLRPPPWINPAASEPCRWPSTGSHFRPHRLWWWWRQELIRSGPAWPWLCPPWWQTWMWSQDSEQKVSERFLDSYCCYYAVLVLLDEAHCSKTNLQSVNEKWLIHIR